MRSLAFLSCLAALLAVTVSAASLAAGQLNMGIGARTNGRWAAATRPGSYLETEKDVPATMAASASSAQAQMDALLTSSSGISGPARVELPLDAISSAADTRRDQMIPTSTASSPCTRAALMEPTPTW